MSTETVEISTEDTITKSLGLLYHNDILKSFFELTTTNIIDTNI